METRLNRPDRLTKKLCDRDCPYVKDDYMEPASIHVNSYMHTLENIAVDDDLSD